MTVHRCVTPTLLACSICERKERLCVSLRCNWGLQNCTHTVHILAFNISSLAIWKISLTYSVFEQLKRQFVIAADTYFRKSYRLSAKQTGLRFLHPVLSQSLLRRTSSCLLDLSGRLRSGPRSLI